MTMLPQQQGGDPLAELLKLKQARTSQQPAPNDSPSLSALSPAERVRRMKLVAKQQSSPQAIADDQTLGEDMPLVDRVGRAAETVVSGVPFANRAVAGYRGALSLAGVGHETPDEAIESQRSDVASLPWYARLPGQAVGGAALGGLLKPLGVIGGGAAYGGAQGADAPANSIGERAVHTGEGAAVGALLGKIGETGSNALRAKFSASLGRQAQRSGGLAPEAANAADATGRIIGNSKVAGDQQAAQSPEAFMDAIRGMSPTEAKAARDAVLARLNEFGVMNKNPLKGFGLSWGSNTSKMAPYIRALDERVGAQSATATPVSSQPAQSPAIPAPPVSAPATVPSASPSVNRWSPRIRQNPRSSAQSQPQSSFAPNPVNVGPATPSSSAPQPGSTVDAVTEALSHGSAGSDAGASGAPAVNDRMVKAMQSQVGLLKQSVESGSMSFADAQDGVKHISNGRFTIDRDFNVVDRYAELRTPDAPQSIVARPDDVSPPGSRSTPHESARNDTGNLRGNLAHVSEDALKQELQRLTEMQAQEHGEYEAIQGQGYRDAYYELPRTERLGRKGQEDLPDASGSVDPDQLQADNKAVSEYSRRTIVRAARDNAIKRIERELTARHRSAGTSMNDRGELVGPSGNILFGLLGASALSQGNRSNR